MANYTLPSTTRISRVNRTLGSSTFLQASPFSGGVQSQDWGGSWWEYDIDFDVTQDTEGKALSAFLTRLRGPANTFTFRDPSINNKFQPGTIRVKGAGQTGNTLVTDGWEPNSGNYLQYSGDFSNALWANSATFTPTAGISTFDGNTWKMTNPGITPNRAVSQITPTYYSSKLKVFSVYVEDGPEVTATDVVTLGIRDETIGSWLIAGTYTFSTDTFVEDLSPVGLGRGLNSRDASVTSNGGARVKILDVYAKAANPENVFRAYIYPTGFTVNTNTSYLYWAGYTEADSYSDVGPVVAGGYPAIGLSSTQRIVFDAGDFISIGSGADVRLYQVVQDATANTDLKESNLILEPALRSSPSDNAVVEVVDPIVALRPLQPVPNSVSTPINYRFTMQARENI